MGKTREIKGRIRAVGNIQRITKTMQMIATARFQAAQRRAVASKPYTTKIAELVTELAATLAHTQAQHAGDAADVTSHPLLRQPRVAKELVLVITSNRGLAGAYNTTVLRAAQAYLKEMVRDGIAVDLEVIGKKGNAYFRFQGPAPSQFHAQFTDKTPYEEVQSLAQRYMASFAAGEYRAIRVISMAFHSMSRQSPRVLTLLPLQPPKPTEAQADATTRAVAYDFTPDPRTLLDELLPITVKVQLYQAFNEGVVSEQISRMIAMKAATDAAKKMKTSLTRRYNRARQAAITTELTEIISGAAALA